MWAWTSTPPVTPDYAQNDNKFTGTIKKVDGQGQRRGHRAADHGCRGLIL